MAAEYIPELRTESGMQVGCDGSARYSGRVFFVIPDKDACREASLN